MHKEINPIANIEDIVQLNCIVQTSHNFRICHLYPKCNYTVEDVEATISLKTGKIKYSYLLSQGAVKGWVSSVHIATNNKPLNEV